MKLVAEPRRNSRTLCGDYETSHLIIRNLTNAGRIALIQAPLLFEVGHRRVYQVKEVDDARITSAARWR